MLLLLCSPPWATNQPPLQLPPLERNRSAVHLQLPHQCNGGPLHACTALWQALTLSHNRSLPDLFACLSCPWRAGGLQEVKIFAAQVISAMPGLSACLSCTVANSVLPLLHSVVHCT